MSLDAKDAGTAEQLKAEGNAHHLRGDYESAHRLYSRAIDEDPTNAVIYANRAQSSLAMKKFEDAEADAAKALKYDPKFSKAWARLATARQGLKKYDESKLAWQHAISCLPDDADSSLSPSDKKLKQQCEAGLESLEALAGAKWAGIDPDAVNSKHLPWDRALAMKQELMNEGRTSLGSSAWVIISAYKDYAEGIETVKMVKRISKGEVGVEGEGNDADEMGWQGKPNALMNLSNGILRDVRVFHVPGKEWMEKFNEQVRFESTMWQAWTLADAEAVKEEAQDRLKAEGWERVRPALSTTVRAWILAGYLASGNSRNAETALDYYGRVLSVLEWGRLVWKDVPPKKRGTIFDDTFLRGVKRLFLQGLIEAYHEDPGPNSEYNLDDIAAMARDLMSDTAADHTRLAAHPNTDYDPGFITSFFINPLGEGMSILGFVHMRKAIYLRAQGNDEAADQQFSASAVWYAKAGNVFPEDDEKHVYFLAISLEAQLSRGQEIRAILPCCEAIRRAIPKMEKIWKFSQIAEGRDALLQNLLNFEDECRVKLACGKATLDSVIHVNIADDIVPGKRDQADPPPEPAEKDAEEE